MRDGDNQASIWFPDSINAYYSKEAFAVPAIDDFRASKGSKKFHFLGGHP
jgi:hypothetical protein